MKRPEKRKTMEMQPIDAAGGILYRQTGNGTEILLIFRKNTWDLPKGKKERGEAFEECAVREVSEEVGTECPVISGHLTDTFHEYEQSGIRFRKMTRWYSMTMKDPLATLTPQAEEDIEKVEWVPIDIAKKRVGFSNLVRVIEAFEGMGGLSKKRRNS